MARPDKRLFGLLVLRDKVVQGQAPNLRQINGMVGLKLAQQGFPECLDLLVVTGQVEVRDGCLEEAGQVVHFGLDQILDGGRHSGRGGIRARKFRDRNFQTEACHRILYSYNLCTLWCQLEDTVLLIGTLLLFDPVLFPKYEA